MNPFRIVLANLPFAATPEQSVTLVEAAIAKASAKGAGLICFPECYVPGYRGPGKPVPPPDAVFLEQAWERTAAAAAKGNVAVILGTERVDGDSVLATALVIQRDGQRDGFQDKVQLDPSEDCLMRRAREGRFFERARWCLGSQFAMRDGAIRKRSAGPCGKARTSCFIRTSTRRNRGVTVL